MNMKKIYSLVLVFFVLVLTACGTDTKENPPQSNGTYSFFNATTPLKITAPTVDINGTVTSGAYTIKIQLLEFGLAKPGESIEMKPFNLDYGFVTNTVVVTDTNGFATFAYNPPERYSDVKGQNFKIEAVYRNPLTQVSSANGQPRKPDILLTQEIELQFR